MDELKLILESNPDISVICLTESHLDNDILNAEIDIDGFGLYRKDIWHGEQCKI